MIMGRASQNVKAIEATNDQYRDLVMEIRKMNMEGKDPQIDWGDPIDHLIRFRQKDLMLTNAIVRSNGELIVDPYLPIILGNLKKHSFTEYWENGLYKNVAIRDCQKTSRESYLYKRNGYRKQ